MSIALIEAELRSQLSGAIVPTTSPLGVVHNWPIQWPNEPWPAGIDLSQANLPLNPDGSPLPCIKAENIVGSDTSAIGPGIAQGGAGRLSTRTGLLRLFLIVGQNAGMGEINTQTDAIWPILKRQTPFANPALWQRLTTMDPRIDDNVAVVEGGDRFVRMIGCPWIFEYQN